MERNLMIAGFGGQGVMVMGKLLAQAVCDSTDKNVSFFPSYGAAQRGGTANCYVVISDEPVGAPLGDEMDDLIVMNKPSLDSFLYKLMPGGTLIVNSSLIKGKINRTDIHVVNAPVTELALEMGNAKVINTIMLGVYIGCSGAIEEEFALAALEKQLGKKPELMALNRRAFAKGLEIGKSQRK